MSKNYRKPETIAVVLVRHGRSLKHESFADLKRIKSRTAEIKWHVCCRKDTVPLETVFVVNCSNGRQENGCSDVTSLKALVSKGIFEIGSDCSDDDGAADKEDEADESAMFALSRSKRTPVPIARFTPEHQPAKSTRGRPRKRGFVKDIPICRSDTAGIFMCDLCCKRFLTEEDALKCDCECNLSAIQKADDGNAASSSRNSYERALSLQQNKTGTKQKTYPDSKHKKRMRFEEACDSAERSDKFEDITAEDESLLLDSELDSSSDYDCCPSINLVDKTKNDSQHEPKETRIKENIKFKREDVSLPEEKRRMISTTTNAPGSASAGESGIKDQFNSASAALEDNDKKGSLNSNINDLVRASSASKYYSAQNRTRIGSMRASTIASAFASMSKNDDKTKIQPEPFLSDSEALKDKHEKFTKKNYMNTDMNTDKNSFITATSLMKWSEDEIVVAMTALRSFIATNGANECMCKHVSETVNTKNPRQCHDFLRRIKTKVESIKKHTSNEYNIYKLLKDYNNYNLPTYRTGKSARKSNTKVTTKDSTKVASKVTVTYRNLNIIHHHHYYYPQHSSSPSLLPSHTLLNAMSSRKKGSLTKNEIKAYISALQDFGGTNKRACLFNYISQKVKTRDLKQCYDFAYRLTKKVEIYKKYTTEDNLIYNLLKSYTNYNLLSSKKSKPPHNDTTKNNTNTTTSSLSRHSPSPSSQAPITPLTSYNKGSWTQSEIKAFVSALRSINSTFEKKDLFEQIAEKVKTRNYKQCHNFPRTVIKRVESSLSPTPEDYIIYDFFKNYDKDKIIKNTAPKIEGVDNNMGNSSFKDTDNSFKTSLSQRSPSQRSPSPLSAPFFSSQDGNNRKRNYASTTATPTTKYKSSILLSSDDDTDDDTDDDMPISALKNNYFNKSSLSLSSSSSSSLTKTRDIENKRAILSKNSIVPKSFIKPNSSFKTIEKTGLTSFESKLKEREMKTKSKKNEDKKLFDSVLKNRINEIKNSPGKNKNNNNISDDLSFADGEIDDDDEEKSVNKGINNVTATISNDSDYCSDDNNNRRVIKN